MGIVNKDGAAIYKYLNFNQIDECVESAKGVTTYTSLRRSCSKAWS